MEKIRDYWVEASAKRLTTKVESKAVKANIATVFLLLEIAYFINVKKTDSFDLFLRYFPKKTTFVHPCVVMVKPKRGELVVIIQYDRYTRL